MSYQVLDSVSNMSTRMLSYQITRSSPKSKCNWYDNIPVHLLFCQKNNMHFRYVSVRKEERNRTNWHPFSSPKSVHYVGLQKTLF